MKSLSVKYRTNQTDWMIQTWDVGDKGFTNFWPVSTWSKSRKEGLKAARKCLEYNRGHDKIPRFKVVRLRDKNIKDLFIAVK